jgi:hypothetical protein
MTTSCPIGLHEVCNFHGAFCFHAKLLSLELQHIERYRKFDSAEQATCLHATPVMSQEDNAISRHSWLSSNVNASFEA